MPTLNIPIKLMKRYRKDKAMWELLAFAVCLKCLSGSSGIHPSVPIVRKLMKCSHDKALRMIERAKRCEKLFYYNEKKNFLVARTFTHGKLDKRNFSTRRKVYTAYCAYCYKFQYEKSNVVSHIVISRLLRDKLMECAIKAKQRKNDFILVAQNSSRSDRATALTCKRLSVIMGMHHTTASRHLRKMEARKQLNVTRYPIQRVKDYRSGDVVTDNPALLSRKPFLSQGFLCVRDANEYRLTGYRNEFMNVIFNHRKRHSHNYSKTELAMAHYDN